MPENPPAPKPFLTKDDLVVLHQVVSDAWIRKDNAGLPQRELRLLAGKIQLMIGGQK